jgi:hypothetical protein
MENAHFVEAIVYLHNPTYEQVSIERYETVCALESSYSTVCKAITIVSRLSYPNFSCT